MAFNLVLYNSFKLKGYDSSTKIDLDNDTIKVALLTASYTPDIDVHDFFDDVSANESSGTGYTAGGNTLANTSWAVVTASDLAKWDADDTSWTISSALSARYIVLYKSTGTSSTSPLIAYGDLGSTYSLASGSISVAWNASGILTLT
jgi:hypothetical protein